MDISKFLQTAGSVLILFATFSWVCGKIVEIYHTLTNRHGKRLHAELGRCFGEDEPRPFTNYFYWHPLIEPLSQPRVVPLPRTSKHAEQRTHTERSAVFPEGHLPGHIAADTFAAAMLDPFPWPTTPESLARMLAANRKAQQPAGAAAADDIDSLAIELLRTHRRVSANTTWSDLLGERSSEFEDDFLQLPVCIHADWSAADSTPLDRLESSWSANRIVPERLRARMLSLMREAEGDIDQFRSAIARWYRETMDRASGRFQRESMLSVFVVALAFAVPLNVNMLEMAGLLRQSLGEGAANWPPGLLSWSGKFAPSLTDKAYSLGGAALAAALAAVGAPFWYDLLDKVSRRSGRGPSGKS